MLVKSLLLDNTKVLCICIFTIFIFIYIKYKPSIINTQQKSTPIALIYYEPQYFNKEIYNLPNSTKNPHILYGSNHKPNIFSNYGYERLLPIVNNIPKHTTIIYTIP